jgi:hypothetical protein
MDRVIPTLRARSEPLLVSVEIIAEGWAGQ